MKLIYCPYCGDMFQLRLKGMRECECGRVKGRYLNNSLAEVSEDAISVAIGNGAFQIAIERMKDHQRVTKDEGDRESYQNYAKIDYAWVRPNTGNGNPHTKVIQNDNSVRELVHIHKDLIIFSNPKASRPVIKRMAKDLKPFVAPAYKTKKGYVITDANHRAQAAIMAGYDHIPCVLLTKKEFNHVAFSETNSIDLKVYPTYPPKVIDKL